MTDEITVSYGKSTIKLAYHIPSGSWFWIQTRKDGATRESQGFFDKKSALDATMPQRHRGYRRGLEWSEWK